MREHPDPEQPALEIIRASNGWLVNEASWRCGRTHEPNGNSFVARTPVELAKIIGDWARKQEETQA